MRVCVLACVRACSVLLSSLNAPADAINRKRPCSSTQAAGLACVVPPTAAAERVSIDTQCCDTVDEQQVVFAGACYARAHAYCQCLCVKLSHVWWTVCFTQQKRIKI